MIMQPLEIEVKQFVNSLINDQEVGSKNEYKAIALESALHTPAINSKMVEVLYKDVMSKRNVNFAIIDQTQGDFTKFKHFEMMTSTIQTIERLLADKKVEEVKLLVDIYNMLIECRSDFEFGYKFDVELVKVIYASLIMACHEIINICIVAYVDYLKLPKDIEFKFNKFKNRDLIVIEASKKFLKAYKSGEWRRFMNEFKKGTKNALGVIIGTAVFAVLGAITAVSVTVAILSAIRELIYLFYKTSMNINDYVKIQNNFLKEVIETENENSPGYKKQAYVSAKMDAIGDFIEGKIITNNKKGKDALVESNKTEYSTSVLKSDLDPSVYGDDSEDDIPSAEDQSGITLL